MYKGSLSFIILANTCFVFFIVVIWTVLYMSSYINCFSDRWFENIFSRSIDCLFILLFPWLCMSFFIWCSLTCLFLHLLSVLLRHTPKFFCQNLGQGACHRKAVFSSRSFMVSGLKFKSLTHFKWIFVSAVRWESNFILFMWITCFTQYYLLKSLFPLSILGSLVKY